MNVHISASEVITGMLLYGIIHGTYKILGYFRKQLQTEAGRIIHQHIKDGHDSRLKHCVEASCATLGTLEGQLEQRTEQGQQGLSQ